MTPPQSTQPASFGTAESGAPPPPRETLERVLPIAQLQSLLDTFNAFFPAVTAILDCEGKILQASGWQDICTRFHRINPESCRNCTESDIFLARNVRPGEYVSYRCKNGLWDVVTPLYLDGVHMGNLYTGQFFYDDEPVDEAFFREQAQRYGYDQEAYLEALRRVPRLSRTHVAHVMKFLVGLTSLLTQLGQANARLAQGIEERERLLQALKAEQIERQKLESSMLQAQKLESLGVLAGGIAHDFNNILTTIIGYADLALVHLAPESPIIANLRHIEQAAMRAADLARQMLAYSGKGKFVVESISLNRLLTEMLHMLQVSISKKAVLRLNLHEHLPQVEGDATQLRQVVMNLVINASEAIGEKSGVISITTGCLDCDRGYLKDIWMDETLRAGLYVYLEVADTGCGMDRETIGKMFDPFFTTKFTGRGLGLSAVMGIVRGHQGGLKVYSESGKGTTLKILLPASSRPEELFDAAGSTGNWKGSGKVLLVDDEEWVRGIGAEMLKELGFSPVITACDGRDALRVFKENPDVSLVVLDLTMPHMDGEQFYRELRQLDPAVQVVMSSGYGEQEITHRFSGKGLAGFVQKPYKLSEFRAVLMKAMPG